MAARRAIGPALTVALGAVVVAVHLSLPTSARGWFVFGALVATLVCVSLGTLIYRPPARGFWWFVAAALALWVVGGRLRVVSTETVGPWDPIFLAGYACLLAAVGVLGGRTWGRAENLLDTAIVAVATGGTLLAVIVEPELRRADLSTIESAVLLCYPLLGTLLFATVLRCVFGAMSYSFSITALLMGIAALAVTAAFLPDMNIGSRPPLEHIFAVGWLVGYVGISAAALDPSMKRVVMTDERVHPVSRVRLAFLAFSILLLPIAVFIAALRGYELKLVLLGGIAVPLSGLVAWRMMLLIRAVERRARSFEEERAALMIVIRNLPLAIWATDMEGVFTFSDGKAISRLGYQPGELVGRNFFELYADQPEAIEDHKRALQGHASSRTIQFGGIVWDAYISPLRDHNGNSIGILGLALDVSVRVRSVERLAQRESMLRQAEQIADIGSWSWDIESDVVRWSDQLFRIFGLEPERLTPTLEGVLEHFHPEDRGGLRRKVMAGLEEGSFTFEGRIIRGNGEERLVSCRGEAIYSNGAATGMFGVAQDVTEAHRELDERKDLEEQLRHTQKMEAVGRLAGGIAHDFNNLLTAIMGHAGLLLGRDDLKADIRDDIREIEDAAGAGRDMTSALLDIGQRRVVEKRHLDVNEVLFTFEPVLRRLIGEDIALVLDVAGGELVVEADQGQLEQVMLNLAVNSREAMPGGGMLTIRTERVDGLARPGDHPIAGRWVVLAFADTGGGIDPGAQDRIFEPFYSTKERGRSRGLGLSIVYGIVTESRGSIDVASEPGKGTEMRVFLPLIHDRAPNQVDVAPDIEPDHGPATILLVEDEATVRSTTQRILSRRGYSVLTAVDGLSAMEILTSDIPIDLLVTDVVMPNMNGVALAEQFLQAQPRAQVIYMSGYTADILTTSGLAGERIDFVPKPFRPEELITKVREVLGRTRDERR